MFELDEEQAFQAIAEHGYTVLPDVLDARKLAEVREALSVAVERSITSGEPTFNDMVDPNRSNVRVYNLPEHDRVFIDLLRSDAVSGLISRVFGHRYIVSNFSANIAHPGSGSMALHSDQALALPPPWTEPWALNVIWCLDDIDAENGATHYLPGSHLFRDFSDVPPDAESQLVPFEAKAGSCVIMEGRLWHTSGSNRSADRIRRLLFAYYCTDFVRPQVNWEAALSPETKAQLDDEERRLLGTSVLANTRLGRFIAR